MMRKIIILVILAILIWVGYMVIVSGVAIGGFTLPTYSDVQAENRKLQTAISELENKNNKEFGDKNNSIKDAISDYNTKKEEYELIVVNTTDTDMSEAYTSADIYNIDFLWATIGNYATEEGVQLQFDVYRSAEMEMSDVTTGSIKYIICDLKFTTSGDYIALTDFIYDLEDDDRLGFEISEFKMKKNEEILETTFTVKGVPINSNNISALSSPVSAGNNSNEENSDTNTSVDNTTNTETENTNTTSTTD